MSTAQANGALTASYADFCSKLSSESVVTGSVVNARSTLLRSNSVSALSDGGESSGLPATTRSRVVASKSKAPKRHAGDAGVDAEDVSETDGASMSTEEMFRALLLGQSNMSKKIDFLALKSEAIVGKVLAHDKAIEDLQTGASADRREIERLKIELRDENQYGRRENIEIRGIPFAKGDEVNVTATVTKVFAACGFHDPINTMLSDWHYVWPKDRTRPPYIICRFVVRHVRNAFVKEARRLKLEGASIGLKGNQTETKIYVSDNLNIEFAKLMGTARKMQKEMDIKHVWFRNEAIHMRQTDTSTIYHIKTDADFAKAKFEPKKV